MNSKKFTLSLAMSSLMFSVATGCSTNSTNFTDKATADPDNPYRSKVEVTDADNYKVLQFTDLHWNTATNVKLQKAFIRSCVEEADPDLIMVTGDSILNGTKKLAIELNNELEKISKERSEAGHKTYFAYTWGNHDKQGSYNRSWINNLAMSSPYSLYRDPGLWGDKVDGEGNYYIDIQKDKKTVWRIYSFDTHAIHNTNGHYDYDSMSKNQLEWYMNQADQLKQESGNKIVPSLNFFHICIPEYTDAFYEYNNSLGKVKYDDYYELNGNVIGYLGTRFWTPKPYSKPVIDKETKKQITTEPIPFHGSNLKPEYEINGETKNFFDVAKSNGCIGMSVGHDHTNDWVSQYKDVILGYGVKTGRELFYTTKKSTNVYGDIVSPATITDPGREENGLQWLNYSDKPLPKTFEHTGATVFTLHPDNLNSAGNKGTFDIQHLYIDTDDVRSAMNLSTKDRKESLSKKWLTQRALDLPNIKFETKK